MCRLTDNIARLWKARSRNARWLAVCAGSLIFCLVITCAWLLGADAVQTSATAPAKSNPTNVVDFQREIRPILVRSCYVCHGPFRAESGLRLDLRANALRGGDTGRAIVSGHSSDSLLYQYVSRQNAAGIVMPPKGAGAALSVEQVSLLQLWIDQGAAWPEPPTRTPNESNSADTPAYAKSEHWAFEPVQNAKPPALRHAWIDTPIDAFILQKLREHKMSPNPQASRLELIRRLTFDLIGLPPTPTSVQAFLNDQSEDAYEHLVDSLLASPRYGERWARHWLDLARYADSDGFENDVDRPNAYKYRDYLIRSFNDDKPYNQFVIEQLAADELATKNPELLAAMGFCRAAPTVTNQINEKNRVDEVDDMVSTTGAAFLGLSVGCARCHDHKYEPISQRDYYRLFAIFDNAKKTDDDSVMHLSEPSTAPRKTFVMLGGDPERHGDEVTPGVPAVLDDPQVPFASGDAATSAGRRLALARWIADQHNPLTARVIVNRIWTHHFGRGLVNTPSNLGQSGEPPTHPELLDYLATQLMRQGWRLKPLHKAIVMSATYRQSSTQDPVKLAVDPTNEWYGRDTLRRLDAESIRDAILAAGGRLNLDMYGPGVKPRLPDSVIATSSKRMWPKVDQETPEHWRRSVYIFVKRTLPVPMLEGFDAPTGTQTCERRMTTTVATQALQLMNDAFSNEQAAFMAQRVEKEVPHDVRRQVQRAYLLALSRPPTGAECRRAESFIAARIESDRAEPGSEKQTSDEALEQRALADFCHVLFNCNEFLYLN